MSGQENSRENVKRCRLQHKLVVCGSAGSGKRSLKNNWSMTSWCSVVEKIADVDIITCQEYSLDEIQQPYDYVSFVVVYLPEDQESVAAAQQALRGIYDSFDNPSVTLVENRFGDYKSPSLQPEKIPVLVQLTIDTEAPPIFWRVSVAECLQLTGVFISCLVKPLLVNIGMSRKCELLCWACSEGKLDVIKLLLPYMDNTDPADYLCCIAAKLSTAKIKSDRHMMSKLRLIVEYISNFGDRRRVLKKVGTLVEQYPDECSIMLNMMGEQGDDKLVCTKLSLTQLPISWIAQDDYSVIDISHNNLQKLPVELFKLAILKKLDVSHNQLQTIPPPQLWNCPKLQDLSLAANDLRSERWQIFITSPASKRNLVSNHPVWPTVSANSLMRVNISSNTRLTLLPEWLCLLTSLTVLDIRDLPHVHSLPPQLSLVRNLCVIKLSPEYITSPPASEVALGTSAILTYLRCRHRGSLQYRHIRVVLLGTPTTGKFTLYSNLVGATDTTKSHKAHMSIGRYEYPQKKLFSNDPRVTFHVVCFTGSESSHHYMSQCFFTYRSIFLLLWKVTDGKEGLMRLQQQLHNIHARVPGSPVILVGTHADLNSVVSVTTVSEWEEELFSYAPQDLAGSPVDSSLPPITHSIVMNCKSRRDVDQLQNVLYKMALDMRNPKTKKSVINELVPRSYLELQSLIQSEVRAISSLKEAPVKRRSQFINFVKSHTFHNTELEDDETEMDAACRFLHEAGVIVHYNIDEVRDIYFLDPQWLCNLLCSLTDPLNTSGSILRVTDVASFLNEVGAASLQLQLLKIMEVFSIAVCLDMDRERFLVPSLLSNKRPPNYPSYDLCAADINCKHFCCGYLLNGFFARLMAQVLLHVKQLSAQLVACVTEHDSADPLPLFDGGAAATMPEFDDRHAKYTVDIRNGYLVQDDNLSDEEATGSHTELKRKLMTLGTLPRSPARDSKIMTLTRPMMHPMKSGHHSSHSDLLLGWVFWQEGMYLCFPGHTQLWLESTQEGVAVIVTGDAIPRVKVLSYITNCVDMLCEEHYLGLTVSVENPCPSCIKRVLRTGHSVNSSLLNSSKTHSGELESPKAQPADSQDTTDGSHHITNGLQNPPEISEHAETSAPQKSPPSGEVNSSLLDLEFSFDSLSQNDSVRKNLFESPSGDDTEFLFPSVNAPGDILLPRLDHVRSHVNMFTNTECITKASTDQVISCDTCNQEVLLRNVDPSVLLEDFTDHLLVDPNQLQYDVNGEELGSGSYAKVCRALYDGVNVAIKVYNGRNKQNMILEQSYKDLRSELSIASQLRHPRISMVTGVCLNPLGIMQELAPLGSLRQHIAKCPFGMTSDVVHAIVQQIADGLHYLHSLFIIHRDIKPSNVLVWCLSSQDGVDVRLTDYGVSQFSSPLGLRSVKGTEEYMAPELCKYGEQSCYDEKVDIFSLGLVIHELVTGRHLFSQMVHKHDQLHRLYHTPPPQLSHALERSLSSTELLASLPNKTHPGARYPNQPINTCHSNCFQHLMEACLSRSPNQRPSAKAISVMLGVCPASLPQQSFFIGSTVTGACLGICKTGDLIIGYSPHKWELLVIISGVWNYVHHPILHPEDSITAATCVNGEVWLATKKSHMIYSLTLPDVEEGHMSWSKLAERPVFMMTYQINDNTAILVGLTEGVAAIYDDFTLRHMLDRNAKFIDVAVDIEGSAPVSCGCYHSNYLWLGCGHHLVAVNPSSYSVTQTYLLSEHSSLTKVVSAADKIWVTLKDSSKLIVCHLDDKEKLYLRSLRLIPKGIPHDKTSIVAMAAARDVLWVGTNGGYLFGFNARSCDLLVMRQQHSAIEDIVLLSNPRQLVTFGKSNLLGVNDETNGSFIVWEVYAQPENNE